MYAVYLLRVTCCTDAFVLVYYQTCGGGILPDKLMFREWGANSVFTWKSADPEAHSMMECGNIDGD
jgi:hypothetical protein